MGRTRVSKQMPVLNFIHHRTLPCSFHRVIPIDCQPCTLDNGQRFNFFSRKSDCQVKSNTFLLLSSSLECADASNNPSSPSLGLTHRCSLKTLVQACLGKRSPEQSMSQRSSRYSTLSQGSDKLCTVSFLQVIVRYYEQRLTDGKW